MEKIFEEIVSGKSADRTELKKMLDYLREDDMLLIYQIKLAKTK